MRTGNETSIRTIASIAIAILMCGTVQAQPAPQFDLDWFSIDGGGQMFSTSRAFELGGTIGQHDAVQLATGGGFELVGGFWAVALVGQTTPCTGDLNGDGSVDIADLAQLLAHFGMGGGATFQDGDSDGDGDVDIADLAALLSNFGTSCP
jgi:hypothetical protein